MKIGDLARAAATPAATIRYYEQQGLLPGAPRTDANYRVYDEAALKRLRFIRQCRGLDMTLDEIRLLLQARDAPQAECSPVNAVLDEHIDHVSQRIRELQALRRELLALRAACPQAGPAADCAILARLDEGQAEARLPVRPADRHV